jgi:hypothetical protein
MRIPARLGRRCRLRGVGRQAVNFVEQIRSQACGCPSSLECTVSPILLLIFRVVGSAYGVEKSSSLRNVLAAAVLSVRNLRHRLKATSSEQETAPVHCEVTFGSLNMLNLGLSVDTSSNSPFDRKGQNMSVSFFGE